MGPEQRRVQRQAKTGSVVVRVCGVVRVIDVLASSTSFCTTLHVYYTLICFACPSLVQFINLNSAKLVRYEAQNIGIHLVKEYLA